MPTRIDNVGNVSNLENHVTNDEQKSVLDVIGWCKDLETRLDKVEKEKASAQHVETGSFCLENDPILTKDGADEKRVITKIQFKKPFDREPIFLPSILAFNTERKFESRLQVWADNITEKGADIVVRTWRVCGVRPIRFI